MLTLKSKAPAFSLPDQDAHIQTLSSQRGKWVLIYFYPKDDTPGCTKEACLIRDVYTEFEKMGITVFGISKDSPKSHKKFKEKYGLPFTLLSDQSTEMIQAYGAWQEKSMFGKKYMGIERMSYLLDGEGMIVKIYPHVDPANHALEILSDIKTFQDQ